MNKAFLRIAVVTTLIISLPGLAATPDPAGTAHYAIQQQFKLGPAGKWDYTAIDGIRQRLYLSRGDHVEVLQLPEGKPVATIAASPHVHGFAFAEDLKLGFISNGGSNSVTVFDLDSMRPRRELKVSGSNPDAILYDPASHKVFTFNGKTNNVTVIDARTLAVVATIPASGRPESAVSDGAGRIFFNIEDNAGIDVIDVATNTITARWKLAGCEEPSGLAIDAVHKRLFSTCQNRIMAVTDAATGERIADLPIGQHPDAADFDGQAGRIFVSNGGGNGTLTVVHEDDPDHYSVEDTVQTGTGAKTMAFDRTSKRVYLPASVDGSFTVLVGALR